VEKYAYITGWGKYIPEVVLTNDDLAKIVDTSDEWISDHTGIRERHIAGPEDTVASMSVAAAKDALDRAGIRGSDLDLIIMATSSPDYLLPGAAGIVQDRLGAHKAAAFGLRAGCSGFVYALSIARQFIATGAYEHILVVGAEVTSAAVDWSDRRTCVLFGDGAGAAILEGRDDPGGIISIQMGTKGSAYDALYVPGLGSAYPPCPKTLAERRNVIHMDGQKAGRFAARTLLRNSRDAVRASGLSWPEIDLFIPHQANLRLIEFAARKLRFPMEKMFINLDRYANMSTASIPVALCEAAEQGRLKDGDHVLLVGFGSGLNWATAVIQWGAPERPRRRLVWWRFVPLPKEALASAREALHSAADTVSSTAGAILLPFLSSLRKRK